MLESIVKAAAILVPLGVSPLLSIGLLGIASTFGYQAPPGLAPFLSPPVFIGALFLGAFIKLGRSTKFTKPLAEAVGGFESLFALFAGVAVMLPAVMETHATPWLGVPAIMAALILTLLATLTIITVRTALDVLTWLSPIPFADFLFQLVKLGAISVLIMLAVFAPFAAVFADLLILACALAAARWSIRTARFGLFVLYDLTVGRFRGRTALPKDAIVPEDLGPFTVFILDVQGMPRRAKAALELKVGRWFVLRPRFFGEARSTPLGDGERATFTHGFFGTTLHLPGGSVLLPPRYRHLVDEMRRKTGAAESPKSAAWIPRPLAQPSTN